MTRIQEFLKRLHCDHNTLSLKCRQFFLLFICDTRFEFLVIFLLRSRILRIDWHRRRQTRILRKLEFTPCTCLVIARFVRQSNSFFRPHKTETHKKTIHDRRIRLSKNVLYWSRVHVNIEKRPLESLRRHLRFQNRQASFLFPVGPRTH